ncbi:TetR/AcrR family transcriptional regulator [Leptospira stimsonii]|uniref:AcrR family transcriptional regulator n=1 Tax=Leptospira stimsonii TaxID=2202203 RepID=A0A4R9LDG1_9LEPT|nr:TetR/AcrR family transcriptional regulator [Leptospira stimsonii]RHX84209.1 AcrR family transcriptional regulator [Leptospira stimsonii]TGK26055.1 TetR/AcrR family transcriptional regulator [Leptospira stimsonii]TGM22488.1 TetR/AcrR family transcriptional regulator [Leptospira stimsonii]
MSSRESGPKSRILETAVRLFQSQGYGNTGINQIIQESKTAKASFYDHFPSKDDLGRAYIEFYGEEQLVLLEKLKSKSSDPQAFIRAWTQILRRQTRNTSFAGCPMANTVAQIASTSPSISEEAKRVSLKTIEILTSYLGEWQKKGLISMNTDPKLLARRVFACYEGVLHTWKLTGKISALDDLPILVDAIFHSPSSNSL